MDGAKNSTFYEKRKRQLLISYINISYISLFVKLLSVLNLKTASSYKFSDNRIAGDILTIDPKKIVKEF